MEHHNYRWFWLSLTGLAVTCMIALVMLVQPVASRLPFLPAALQELDLLLQDRFVSAHERPLPLPDVVFVGIDQSTLKIVDDDESVIAANPVLQSLAQPFPWSRDVWAEVVKRLADSGARLILLDLLFPTVREGDALLAEALEQHADRVVIAGSLEPRAQFQGSAAPGVIFAYPAESILPIGSPLEESVGFVNFRPGRDGRIRRIELTSRSREFVGMESHPDEEVFHSMVSISLGKLGHSVPDDGRREMRWVKNLADAYPVIPLYEIFWPSLWERNFHEGEFFRDKIVIVGAFAPQLQDLQNTPEGNINGPLIHINALTNALRDTLFRRCSPTFDAVLIFLMALSAMLAVGMIRKPVPALAALGALLAIFLAASSWYFTREHVVVALVGPSASLLTTGLFCLAIDYSGVLLERLRLKRALGSRLSTDVMQEIVDNPASYLNQLGGVRREITVLFSDLRGFTQLSENREPEELFNHLNEFFSDMVPLIQAQRGMVDKLIGDAIMAVWGSVPDMEISSSSEAAAIAAVDMQRNLALLNKVWSKRGIPPLKQGIGIHCGVALTGNIGSEKHLELTAMGDTVNLASRLESVSKQYGAGIVVSTSITNHLGDGWLLRPLDYVKVVGRNEPVQLVEIISKPGEAIEDDQRQWISRWTEAYQSYQRREFEAAQRILGDLRKLQPTDLTLEKLYERCDVFRKDPPADDWDGSVSLASK